MEGRRLRRLLSSSETIPMACSSKTVFNNNEDESRQPSNELKVLCPFDLGASFRQCRPTDWYDLSGLLASDTSAATSATISSSSSAATAHTLPPNPATA